jgi:2-polyprenyl-3-methyl-5-hydroxy-6-metoxy-1,4-benzoquinol methylase
MNNDIVSYYRDRANEYESIYLKAERQDDLQTATSVIQGLFTHKNVLEIACGTGYWTERIAKTASSVYAIDINKSVIEIARQKGISEEKVTFRKADIYKFTHRGKFENLFGGFIWSHVLLQDLDKFLNKVNSFITPKGTVVFIDNIYVEGSNHYITKTDKHGNTFQKRKLGNGTSYLILKNFPQEKFIFQTLSGIATEINIINLTYYWILSYQPNEK